MEEKPYQNFSEHLKYRFGVRVHKISVDAGFGCPNRSGGRSGAGCLFCDRNGSGAVGIDRQVRVAEQIERGKEVMSRKYKAGKYMAYFQPFSNTYASTDRLRELYDEALAVDDVVGLAVGTRPDCVPPETLELLEEYAARVYKLLPNAEKMNEVPVDLSRYYRLPEINGRPITLKIHPGLQVKGEILGVKGPILYIEMASQTYTLDTPRLLSRRIIFDDVKPRNIQSGLGRFLS